MGQIDLDTESRERELHVHGKGVFVLRDLPAEDDLQLGRRLREWPRRANARQLVNEFIAMAVVRPQLTADQVDELPVAVRRRLRLAALEAVGAATDYRRLGGSFLSADERAFGALEWRRRREVEAHYALLQRVRERRERLAAEAPSVSLRAQRAAEQQFTRQLKGMGILGVNSSMLKALTGGFESPWKKLGVSSAFDFTAGIDTTRHFAEFADIGQRRFAIAGLAGGHELRRTVLGNGVGESLGKSILAGAGFQNPLSLASAASIGGLDQLRLASAASIGGFDQFRSLIPPPTHSKIKTALASYGSLQGLGTRMLRDSDIDALRAIGSHHLAAARIAFRAEWPHMDMAGLGGFNRAYGHTFSAGFGDADPGTLEDEFIEEAELDEAFRVIAWLTHLRTKSARLAGDTRAAGARALDASNQWLWRYPLARLADYREVAPYLTEPQRRQVKNQFEAAALCIVGALHQSWDGVGPSEAYLWGMAWLVLRGAYAALDVARDHRDGCDHREF